MNTRCPPKRYPSVARFFSDSRLTMQPPQSYSVGGPHSSGKIIQYQTVRYDILPLSPISRNRLCRRITQDEEIHKQAEGGREPGSSRTEAQRRYRCTKELASLQVAYIGL
ncbi:UNVERIFIED_CONTAM: hypothetical protein FKN15_020489 [Acipenser sinensis]